MPVISVIVPVYNVERFLPRCLDSILKQSFRDFEIICVNDCSPDNSIAILEKYEKDYPDTVRVICNDVNQGLGKTRENGLAVAKGQYVMFIDSDDYIKEDYLETYYNRIKGTDLDLVIAGYIKDINGEYTQHLVEECVWSIVTYPIACAKMYKKSFLLDNDIHFSRIRCGEDIYFSMSVYYYEPKYEVMPYAGYYYYYNDKSITGSLNYDKEHEKFVSQIFTEFLENHDLSKKSKEFCQVIEYNYFANMVNALITYGKGSGIKRMKKKYEFWLSDMKEKFPEYIKNPYVGISKSNGQTTKIRLGVGVIMGAMKIGLAKPVLYLFSIMK